MHVVASQCNVLSSSSKDSLALCYCAMMSVVRFFRWMKVSLDGDLMNIKVIPNRCTPGNMNNGLANEKETVYTFPQFVCQL
jgi:hypothetical protein